MNSANWTWQTGWGEPPYIPWDAGLLFNIPQSPPAVKGAIHRPALLQNPGSFLKQDVCLRPPSPQINNPQNLISGGRVEALESHYFHIPYPGALGLLRECGRPGAGKAQGCGGNLRPCARLQREMSSSCITLGSEGPCEGDHAWLTCWWSCPSIGPLLFHNRITSSHHGKTYWRLIFALLRKLVQHQTFDRNEMVLLPSFNLLAVNLNGLNNTLSLSITVHVFFSFTFWFYSYYNILFKFL